MILPSEWQALANVDAYTYRTSHSRATSDEEEAPGRDARFEAHCASISAQGLHSNAIYAPGRDAETASEETDEPSPVRPSGQLYTISSGEDFKGLERQLACALNGPAHHPLHTCGL